MARTKAISKKKRGVKKQKKPKQAANTANKLSAAGVPVTTAKKATPKKRIKQADKKSTLWTPEERHQKIAIAAYYRAEKRGFQCRCCERDWFDAEAEIDSMS
jgi:hypothetical protein